MAEIELSVLGRQCINKRIPNEDSLKNLVAAFEAERNLKVAVIHWFFTAEQARRKFVRLYPQLKVD